jgi:hypothetical protein
MGQGPVGCIFYRDTDSERPDNPGLRRRIGVPALLLSDDGFPTCGGDAVEHVRQARMDYVALVPEPRTLESQLQDRLDISVASPRFQYSATSA